MVDRPGVNRIPAAIFFLSDYGTADEFVGVVHAVIHHLAPGVAVIDLSHQIPVFDVAAGADMLVRCAPSLGPGVVLAVVDPGVGTDRRAVAVRLGGPLGGPLEGPLGEDGDGSTGGPQWLVGPDNGLLLPVAGRLGGVQDAWDLGTGRGGQPGGGERRPAATDADPPARTFDGRDVFAPAAAHLALGGDPAGVGSRIDPAGLMRLPRPGAAASQSGRPGASGPLPGSVVSAAVSWIDRFGNVQLRLTGPALEAVGIVVGSRAAVTLRGHLAGRRALAPAAEPVAARRVGAFGELDAGELGLMVDANGQVALVLDRASAARHLGLDGTGGEFTIAPGGPGAG